MASLYIKDPNTAEAVTRVALRMGTSKTQAVRDAIRKVEAELDAAEPKQNWLDWMKEHREKNPLPPPTGLKADKAFFDEMWGED